ncbi:glycosyltransferase [Novosphingobium guangzhouense]|uniref:Glycosyl transferase family 1 domain-containing protein n=1 Tax=Novosphingobium guangzhouense TaxID=1850347 RepID=A0A2K2G014_9SPHN|nr:glycosyltransferase [Novosphingobium guangzhouense]PNU04334.1 hypothetical protein A8V01_20795 [Novosphingobium guangzhouense]
MPTLLLSVPAPVKICQDGYHLDTKFVAGMQAHVADWGSDVRCVMWDSGDSIPFGQIYRASELNFDLIVLDRNAAMPPEVLEGVSIALVSADMPGFGAICRSIAAARIPYVVGAEYTLDTRLRTVWLERHISFLRKVRRSLWLLRNERRIRTGIKSAASAQFNGYPAFDSYAELVIGPHIYLDNRMSAEMMASPAEMVTRSERLLSGRALRLIHSGRLEPMKGSQDLLQVMRELSALGVRATLDIYGTGSLEAQIRSALGEFDGAVRLHAPVDFRTELVPVSRTQADIFLSCHRQSDPSCSYLEAMGCGLAIAGYRNRMWEQLSKEAQCGVAVPLGSTRSLAKAIARWDRHRQAIVDSAQAGLSFAMTHDFEREFAGRMAHLRSLVV